jgi:hypothetical protein
MAHKKMIISGLKISYRHTKKHTKDVFEKKPVYWVKNNLKVMFLILISNK